MIRSFMMLAIVIAQLVGCGAGSSTTTCSGDACCVCGGTAAAGCSGVAVGTYSSATMMTTCASSTLSLDDIRLDVSPGVLATISFNDSGTEHTSNPAAFSCTDKSTLLPSVDAGQGCTDTITFDLTPMGPTQVSMDAKLERTCPAGQGGDLECRASGVLTRAVD